MKKLFTLAALLFVGANIANAQIGKGDVMVGGQLAGLNANFKQNISFNITPKAAWFIEDRIAVGAYLNFGIDHAYKTTGSTYTYGVGPLARYYFSKEQIGTLKQFKFFAEGHVGFEGSNVTGKAKSNTNGLGFGVGPGITYFLTPTVGLESTIKYGGIVGFGSDAYKNQLTFGIGLQVYLPGQKTIQKIKTAY